MKQYNSLEAFRYIWLNWTVFGLSPQPNQSRAYKVYSIVLNLTMPMIPAVQMIIQLFFAESFADIINNLSVSLEWVCGDVRHCLILLWHMQLYRSHQFLERLDERLRRSDEEVAIMRRVVKNCQRVYFGYNAAFGITVIFFVISNLVFRRLMYEAYFPWDWRASYGQFLAAYAFQILTSVFQSCLNLTIDAYAICYVHVMAGHVKTLGMRISRIGYEEALTREENYKELIEYFDHFRSIVGSTIFVQFFVTAFALGLAAIYCMYFSNSLGVLLSTAAYLSLLFAQIMPCCYVVNDLMIVSHHLTTDLYSCNWLDQDLKFRKALVIFMQRSQRIGVIMAGNLTPVTLQTCLSILRFSFSMFTLLARM